MNPDPSKLRQQQEQQTEQRADSQLRQQNQQEFQSVEHMIRFDAQQTEVPESLTQRVQSSVAAEPKPVRPWWKRLLRWAR
jgi:hypothetical protein